MSVITYRGPMKKGITENIVASTVVFPTKCNVVTKKSYLPLSSPVISNKITTTENVFQKFRFPDIRQRSDHALYTLDYGSLCKHAVKSDLESIPLAKQTETTKMNERNQMYNDCTETEIGYQYECTEVSMHRSGCIDITRLSEVDYEDSFDALSSGIEQSCDISVGNDSESESERAVHMIRRKKKGLPTHRKEFSARFTWEFSDDESEFPAPFTLEFSPYFTWEISSFTWELSMDDESFSGVDHHLSATGGALKLSHLSPAQRKSRRRREAMTDTSSEVPSIWSHTWHVDIFTDHNNC